MSNFFLPRNLFITGMPRVGKTTLVKKVISETYPDKFVGFYTEDILDNNVRIGFKIINTNKQEEIFALKHSYKNIAELKNSSNLQHYKKYDVFIDALFQKGIKLISEYLNNDIEKEKIIVIDEIGSMECLSLDFCKLITEILQKRNYLLATLRYNSHPFIDDVKRFSDSKLLVLNKKNFNEVFSEVKSWVKKILNT